MDLPILNALETLLNESAMTIPEALEKAYKAGHRTAVKSLEPIQLVGIGGSAGMTTYTATTIGQTTGNGVSGGNSSTRGLSPVK